MVEVANQRISYGDSIYGNDVTIRNVAVTKSPLTQRGDSYHNLHVGVEDPDGVGVIDHAYLSGGGIYVHPSHHAGTLYIKNVFIERAVDNGLYADEPTTSDSHHSVPVLGGTVHVGNCYLVNNNISHVRLNAGSSVQNTVVHNTGNVPRHPNGRNSRGLHTFYGYGSEWGHSTVEAKNIHVEVTDSNTGGASTAFNVREPGNHGIPNPVWNVTDSHIVGDFYNNSRENYNPTNVGSDPTLQAPSGVPTSAQEAINGNNDGSPGLPGGGFRGNYTPPEKAITEDQEELAIQPE